MKRFALKLHQLDKLIAHGWGAMLFALILYPLLSSYVIGLIAILVCYKAFQTPIPKINLKQIHWAIPAMIALFSVYAFDYFMHVSSDGALMRFERKFALLIIPLLWFFGNLDWNSMKENIYSWLIAGIFIAGTFMLLFSIIAFSETLDYHEFFYHQLTPPIGISPIYFAWFIVIALAWPRNLNASYFSDRQHNWITIALLALLMLCASKLFTMVGIILLIYKGIGSNAIRLNLKTGLIALLILGLSIPALMRSKELLHSQMDLVTQDQYKYDSPFNGFTLRLVLVRLGFEILQEENAWMSGVGLANSQARLNDQYRAHNIYTGNPELGDKGMLAYNYHNQWMETTASIGAVGALILILLFISLFNSPNHRSSFTSILIVCLIFTLTESYLERAQGLIAFTFLACIISKPTPID